MPRSSFTDFSDFLQNSSSKNKSMDFLAILVSKNNRDSILGLPSSENEYVNHVFLH